MNTKEIQYKRANHPSPQYFPRIGIGSYAYRYNIGFPGFNPPTRMDLNSFVDVAITLDLQGVQLCENLNYIEYDLSEIKEVSKKIHRNNMFLELGMRDMTYENLVHHLDLAERLETNFIRVVAGKPNPFPEKGTHKDRLIEDLFRVFEKVLPQLKKRNIRIGLENHYDLSTDDIVHVVHTVNDEMVGVVFDTTNALGFIEKPEETLEAVLPFLFSIHVKDYIVEKVEAGYLIKGTALGEGLLNYKSILEKVVKNAPGASIILEMTIRRDNEMDMNEVVKWENSQVAKSINELQKYIKVLQTKV